ncbi:MAG: hypothetical protein H6965_14800 [Chromatiaceae bacterium]|nr:hypothetical protein [Chromatiaceae bacterium]
MKYSTPRIVQHQGGRLLRWILIVLLMCIVAVASYYITRQQIVLGAQEMQAVIRLQKERIAELEQNRYEAEEKLAKMERTSLIDREAMRLVKEELANFQEERAQLDEEMIFLRSMVSAKDEREGVQVHRFSLKSGTSEHEYRFRFTVSQAINNGEPATGWVFLAVDGLRGSEPVWLPLREITEESTERIKMRFNHFQDIEGVIKLPEDFKPLKVIVEVKPSNKNMSEVKQRFDWVVKG